jgi:hypothetical protein
LNTDNKKVVKGIIALAAIVSVVLLAMATWLAVRYRQEPIIELFGFRQTQTALTSYWACRGGLGAAYWTPVAGYPWAIPMEFPIYQWIVSIVGCSSTATLDEVGRLTSYVFWVACFAPVWLIFRRLFGVSARLYFWIFSALFVSAPLYLFWGRTFLMETAALFFTLMYVAYALEMSLGRDRWRDALLTGVFLTLAVLQKSTTVLPMLVFAPLYLWMIRGSLREFGDLSPRLWRAVVAYLVPVLIGFAWVKYSDHVKTFNALGIRLTSSALSSWNFGTLEGRLSKALWVDVIWRRVAAENIAGILGVFVILVGFIFAPRRRMHIACGVGFYLLFFMVFENLLFVHLYYPVSNTIYLIFALAVAIGGLIENHPKLSVLVTIAFAAAIALNLRAFFGGELYAAESRAFDGGDTILAPAKYVREHTSKADPIIIYGEDWSSEIPYYAERRSFAVPKWFHDYLGVLDAPSKYFDQNPDAILVCGDALNDKALATKIAAEYQAWSRATVSQCAIYVNTLAKN